MKSYEILADFYDKLVIDQDYVDELVLFIKKYSHDLDILEMACGTGAITRSLFERGFKVTAFDLSKDMILKAKEKLPTDIEIFEADMREFRLDKTYSTIVCMNDSINYLNDLNEVKSVLKRVYDHLNSNGVFIFDMHHILRLDKFQEEYIEEGIIDDLAYQWTIISDENKLLHTLTFYFDDKTLNEYHIQNIFAKDDIVKILDNTGFVVRVFTDFDQPEEHEGEKWYLIAQKR